MNCIALHLFKHKNIEQMFPEAACDHDAHCGALSPAHDLCVILLQLSTLISMMLSAHIRLLLCACVCERQSVWACVNATFVYSNNLSHFSCLESFTLAKAFYMSYVVVVFLLFTDFSLSCSSV